MATRNTLIWSCDKCDTEVEASEKDQYMAVPPMPVNWIRIEAKDDHSLVGSLKLEVCDKCAKPILQAIKKGMKVDEAISE